MKSKVFTISASGINSGQIQEVDLSLYISSYVIDNTDITENETYYPKQIVIDNNTNSDIGYVTLSSIEEYQIYSQHPEWFDFIPIKSKISANALNSPRTLKLLIKKLNDSVTYVGKVEIVCIGYVK